MVIAAHVESNCLASKTDLWCNGTHASFSVSNCNACTSALYLENRYGNPASRAPWFSALVGHCTNIKRG